MTRLQATLSKKEAILCVAIVLGLHTEDYFVLGEESKSWFLKQNGTLDSCSAGTSLDVFMTKCADVCSDTNCSGFMYEESGESHGGGNNNNNINDNKKCTICPLLVNNRFVASDSVAGVFLRLDTQHLKSLYPDDVVEIQGGIYPGRVVLIRGTVTEDSSRMDFLHTASETIALRLIHDFNASSPEYFRVRSRCDSSWTEGDIFYDDFLQENPNFRLLFMFRQTSVMVYLNDAFLVDYPYQCSYGLSDIQSFVIIHGAVVDEFGMN